MLDDPEGMQEFNLLKENVEELRGNQARFFDFFLGPEEKQLDGTILRATEEGIDYKVNELYQAHTNGGFRIKLPAGAWVLLAAVTTALGGIAVAMLQNLPSPPSP